MLDLRNDPGGLLFRAVAISAAFLAAKTLVVATDGGNEDAKRKYFAIPEDSVRSLSHAVGSTAASSVLRYTST